MTIFDMIFWLLIVLIMVLAYAIESGLSARHRTVVLSSIMSATLAAVYLMFLVEDNSKFGTGEPVAQKDKEKKKIYSRGGGEGGLKDLSNVEVVEETGPDSLESVSRYKDGPLLRKANGFRDCPACPLMVMIPVGRIIVGSPADEPNRRANEGPQKVVRISRPFTVSRFEILFSEFAAFVAADRYSATTRCMVDGKSSSADWQRPGIDQPTPNHPVVCLTWNDATAYAKWLSKKTGRTYRLPAESEWEYMARARTVSPYWIGDTIKSGQANFGGVTGGTSNGGTFESNPFKVFDTAGNVWEMTDDCWSDTLANVPSSGVSERGLGDCTRSPIRGGAWNSPAVELRSAYRRPLGRDQAFNTVGIRLVREIQ